MTGESGRTTRFKRLLVVGVAAIALLAGPGPALAWLHPGSTTQYPPEGGVWTYGFWDLHVRSYYDHPSSCHGSTADFWDGFGWHTAKSLDTHPGQRSVAEVGGYNLPWTDDRYWYRIVRPGFCPV
ncbi:MAG: hypothetical protein C4343_02060 [Chloroflexota bacterium]